MQTMRIALLLLWQPVLLRRTLGKPWVQWLMLALTVGFIVLALVLRAKPAVVLACIVGAGQLAVWWGLFVTSIGLQHAQRGARLVPQLRRIALATTVLVWLCLVLIIMLAAGGVFGHHALWALLAGLGLAAVALVVAGRWEALVFIPAVLMVWRGSDGLVPFAAALLATPAGMAGGAALLCASMSYTLYLLLGRHDGKSRHGRFLEVWGHMVRGTQPEQGPLMRPFAAVYAGCLRQDCARQDKQNLLLHALGPSLHWSLTLSAQLPMLLVSAVFCMLPALNLGQTPGLVVGSMIASQLLLHSGVARAAAGQPEQALLRLAPAMPVSNALNRMLARGLLGLFFRNWIVAMGCSALLLVLAGVPQTEFIGLLSSMSVSVLLAAGMLRNYALANNGRDRVVRGLLYGLTFALMLAIQLVPAGFLLLGSPGLQAPGAGRLATLSATLLVMLVAGLIVWWRWRAMLAAPPAFPAARI